MVALHDRASEAANYLQTLSWIRRVADDVTKTNALRDRLRIHVCQDGLQSLQVRVDIGEHR